MRLSFGSSDPGDEGTLPPPEGGGSSSARESDVSPGDDSPPRKRGRPKGSSNQASLTTLEGRLKDKILEDICAPITLASPLAAANIEARADRTCKAAMRLAAKNPQVRKGIEKFIDGSDVLTLALFPITTIACFAADWGMLNPLSVPGRAAGIPKLWEEVYPDEPLDTEHGYTSRGAGRKGKRGLMADIS